MTKTSLLTYHSMICLWSLMYYALDFFHLVPTVASERDGALDDFTSLYGTIWCQLLDDQITDAEQQLEFLNDVTTERNVKLVFLTALHASKVPGADIETPLTELERLLTSHLAASRSRTFGFDYFVAMDPDLLTQCAELFLSRESGELRGKNAPMSPGVEKALSLLTLGRLYEGNTPSSSIFAFMVWAFIGAPLSACSTRGWWRHCSRSKQRCNSPAA